MIRRDHMVSFSVAGYRLIRNVMWSRLQSLNFVSDIAKS